MRKHLSRFIGRDEFLAAMRKGWETLGYARGYYFKDEDGEVLNFSEGDIPEGVSCACAFGAAGYILGLPPGNLHTATVSQLSYQFDKDTEADIGIASISDSACNKEDAIACVTAEVMKNWPADRQVQVYYSEEV